jgi:hypothetical protein
MGKRLIIKKNFINRFITKPSFTDFVFDANLLPSKMDQQMHLA